MSKYITVTAAAKLANRHRQSIYNAVEAGLIRAKKDSNRLLVLAIDVVSAERRRVWRRKNRDNNSAQ